MGLMQYPDPPPTYYLWQLIAAALIMFMMYVDVLILMS